MDFESHFNTLKEMVLDEEKLVTYVSLSKDLCMHTNESKSLLEKFANEVEALDSLCINYIISGLTDDNKALTKVCPKADLANEQKQFQSIFFEHIYSVAKGKPCFDNAAYMSVNRFENFSLYKGLIKGKSCSKRSSTEIGVLITNSQQKADHGSESMSSVQSENKVRKELNGYKHEKTLAKPVETKSEPIIKKEALSPKKDNIPISPKQNVKKNGNKTQKGIAGFFGKSNSTPAQKVCKFVDTKSEKPTGKKTEKEVKIEIGKLEVESPAKVTKDDVEVDQDPKPKVNIKKEKPNNKALDKIKKNAKVDKKRKRVLKVSDSESEEETSPFAADPPMDVDNDSADEIPPTPTINTVKITSGFINPKKKRKIVDKTYTDDEGYILTKKVEVYESCSDNEEVTKENAPKNILPKTDTSPKEAKATPKTTKKKISPPQKGKQATMMNFFKKV